jgi:predicted CXXCH cytochrome family protein
MNIFRTLCIAVILAVVAGGALHAQGISSTAHDFSAKSWNSSGQICKPCHTPHNASTTVSNAPLWNHATTTSTFTLYSSATMNATMGQPDESSKLCLSCHDGTVALENFSGTTTGTNYITGTALMGTSLANDHPVSFTYNTSLATADGGLHDPATKLVGAAGSGTIQQKWLFSDKMQCASCHDVHNGLGISKLLVKTNASSSLCLTCHNK